jgi:hypothetical protein
MVLSSLLKPLVQSITVFFAGLKQKVEVNA